MTIVHEFSLRKQVPAKNAIFFVGDRVRDTGNSTVERLSEPENIATALLPKLGHEANLWIVEPSHYMGPFACYENILPSLTASGEPVGYNPKGLPAARACLSILDDCLAQVKTSHSWNKCRRKATAAEPQGREILDSGCVEKASPFEPFLDAVDIVPPTILLGFSKGGVILNQLLAEIVHFEGISCSDGKLGPGRSMVHDKMPGDPEWEEVNSSSSAGLQLIPSTVEGFLSSIREVHFVDVGLNCQGAYQTDPRVLKGLAKAARSREPEGLYLGFHGTPRQWRDGKRPWIAMEKSLCLGLLKEAAVNYGDGKLHVNERLYFGERRPNLEMHYEIIDALLLRH